MTRPSLQQATLPTIQPLPADLPIRLLDLGERQIWRGRDAVLRDARARVTTSAFKAITQAALRGLKVEVYGESHTEITGGFGHKLVISHRRQTGQPRVTRFRLARLDGTLLDTFDAAHAAGWIATQPRADRCRTITPRAPVQPAGAPRAPRSSRRASADSPDRAHLSIVR